MKQEEKQGQKNKTGAWGEKIAVNFLKQQGFTILEQNYLKKWGEIDIVARGTKENNPILKFVEVKTVSHGTKQDLKAAISRGTYRPEENFHYTKLKRLEKAITTWLLENKVDLPWEIDVIAVRIVPREKYATVKYLENVILD